MNKIVLIFVSLCSFLALSKEQVLLSTPRGVQIKIDIYNKGAGKALLLGQGSGCSNRFDIYDNIAEEAQKNNFTLVRIYWAYCVASPPGEASPDGKTEIEDFQTALKYLQSNLGYSLENIIVGGKSLGTFISFEVFKQNPQIPALVFLTPVCTDQGKNIFSENYLHLENEKRLVLLAQGNADELCNSNHFLEYVKDKSNNFVPLTVRGGHSLTIDKAPNTPDEKLSYKNIKTISQWIFTWL